MNEIVWIVAAVLIAAASAGCGSGGDGRRADAASPAPIAEPDTPASPAPAAKADAPATQGDRVAGLPAGWELAPRTKITGRQAAGEVTITASGDNPTGGYQNKLFQSPLRIWPPQFILARKKPDGPA